jgi:hypothetical protein
MATLRLWLAVVTLTAFPNRAASHAGVDRTEAAQPRPVLRITCILLLACLPGTRVFIALSCPVPPGRLRSTKPGDGKVKARPLDFGHCPPPDRTAPCTHRARKRSALQRLYGEFLIAAFWDVTENRRIFNGTGGQREPPTPLLPFAVFRMPVGL